MKRKWSEMNGLADLGFSGSVFRTLNSVGSALEEAERTNADIRGAGLGKMGAGLRGALGGMDGRIRPDGCLLGTAAKIADAIPDARANANAALGKIGIGLGGSGLKDITGIRFEDIARGRLKDIAGITAAKDLGLGNTARPYAAFDTPDLAKDSSLLSSVSKMSELAGAIPKSTALGLPQTMLGVGGDLLAARADGLLASAWKVGWKDDFLLPGWENDLLSSVYPGISGWLGTADAVKNVGAWWDAMSLSDTDWLYGPTRGLGLFGKSGGTLPAFEALDAARRVSGWGLGGLLDTIGRIDVEAIRRAASRKARVWGARRPRTRIGFAALEAYDAFYLGQPWVADEFLMYHLGIEPDEDRREALWLVLRWTFERTVPRPAKWLVIDDESAIRYLRAAVHKNARRVRRDKERPDRVWWEERDPATKKKVELPPPTLQPEYTLEFMMKSSGNPADIVVPPADERGRVLQMLYIEGTEQDRKMVGMLIAGFDLAATAHVVGWPEVQRFTRKAQRWRRIKLDPPPGG